MSDLGDTLAFRADVTDDDGALVNAADATLTITLPDGSTVDGDVTNPATGKYACDYPTTTLAGRYVGRWLFTFAGGTTATYSESFDVGPSMITVDEALAHLRATGTITTEPDLEQLQWLCQVATDAVERDLNRVCVPRSFTDTFIGCHSTIFLRVPVIAVDLVTSDGTEITDSILNKEAGMLYRGATGWHWSWSSGYETVTVTYTAGHYSVPLPARQVALNTVQELWQSSQQSPNPFIEETSEPPLSAALAALPDPVRRAYESLRVPSIG